MTRSIGILFAAFVLTFLPGQAGTVFSFAVYTRPAIFTAGHGVPREGVTRPTPGLLRIETPGSDQFNVSARPVTALANTPYPCLTHTRVTAYTGAEDPIYGFSSAFGPDLRQLVEGLMPVATDPCVIPIGSIVYVPYVGRRIARDTGSAVRGRHVDVFVRTLAEIDDQMRHVPDFLDVQILRRGW